MMRNDRLPAKGGSRAFRTIEEKKIEKRDRKGRRFDDYEKPKTGLYDGGGAGRRYAGRLFLREQFGGDDGCGCGNNS